MLEEIMQIKRSDVDNIDLKVFYQKLLECLEFRKESPRNLKASFCWAIVMVHVSIILNKSFEEINDWFYADFGNKSTKVYVYLTKLYPINNYEELMKHKPKKTWDEDYWFWNYNHDIRINIAKEIVNQN